MKKALKIFILAAVLAAPLMLSPPAQAGNSSVEATLQSFGDLSMFYQALLNSGLINELSEDRHYTIFAPTNAAFAEIQPQAYPCFYSVECRPQIANLLRGHIISGRHDTADLVTYGGGIRTLGGTTVHVREPYVNSYAVDHRAILSKTEVAGNIIYRIDGVLATPQDLAPFRMMVQTGPMPLPGRTVTTRRVVTTYAPEPAVPQPYPAGAMVAPGGGAGFAPGGNMDETTTIIGTTTTGEEMQ